MSSEMPPPKRKDSELTLRIERDKLPPISIARIERAKRQMLDSGVAWEDEPTTMIACPACAGCEACEGKHHVECPTCSSMAACRECASCTYCGGRHIVTPARAATYRREHG